MENYINKPKLTSVQLINKMNAEKGITINYLTETQAVEYLQDKNNYMRLASYRKNYDKDFSNTKYKYLDFSYLIELSTIDMYLRHHVMKMCINIEHQLKIHLLKDLEGSDCDGYNIVNDFLDNNHYIIENIKRKSSSTYTGELINNYFEFVYVLDNDELKLEILKVDCPVWVFLEIISFGDFIKFYEFYYNKHSKVDKHFISILSSVKSIRNACAHNNCILYNLRPANTIPNKIITNYVSDIDSISKDQRKKKLSSRIVYELVCLIYTYDKVVGNESKGYYSELKYFTENRLTQHRHYFDKNDLIKSTYNFFVKILDKIFINYF